MYPEDKSSLQSLIEVKGKPLGVVSSELTTLGYHNLKAIHINEPALYSLIFGSKKSEAKLFKKYVCSTILPSIRRQGYFGSLQKRDEGLQLALKTRDDELQLALKTRDEELQLALQKRDEALAPRVQQVVEAVTSGLDSCLAKLEESLWKCERARVSG